MAQKGRAKGRKAPAPSPPPENREYVPASQSEPSPGPTQAQRNSDDVSTDIVPSIQSGSMDSNGTELCDEESAKGDTSAPAPATHRYGTRASNRTGREVVNTGSVKPTQKEKSAAAALKKAAAIAAKAQRDADEAADKAALDKKKDFVAMLENRKAGEVILERDHFSTAPKIGDFAAPARSRQETLPPHNSPPPRVPSQVNQVPRAGRAFGSLPTKEYVRLVEPGSHIVTQPYKSKAFSALADEYDGGDSDSASGGDPIVHAEARPRPTDVTQVSQDWYSDSEQVIDIRSSSVDAASNGYQDDANAEEDEAEDDIIEIDDNADDDMLGTQGKLKRLTAAERRAHKQQEIRGDLVLRRAKSSTRPDSAKPSSNTSESLPETGTSARTKPAMRKPAASKNAQASASTSNDALNVGWRQRLQVASRSSPSLNSTPQKSAAFKAPRSNSAAKQISKRRNVLDMEDGLDGERIGGFTDQDVHADHGGRTVVHRKSFKASSKNVDIYEVPEDEELARTQKRKSAPATSKSAPAAREQKKPKKARTASDDEPANSKAYDALPDWVKPEIKTIVVPSIRDFFGHQDNPWALDSEEYTFRDLLQEILDTVFPQHEYNVQTSDDNVYTWCKQQAYDWRHKFQMHANTAVQRERNLRLADKRLAASERSERGMSIWQEQALCAGGEAMWGDPDIRVPGNARKHLQSKYILQVMANHLGSTVNSVLVQDDQYPVGALALAAAAVQRSFEWYLYDQPKGIEQGHFSMGNAGGLTAHWRKTAVADLLATPHRFDRLLETATSMTDVSAAKTKPCRSQLAAAAMYSRERSSSPAS